MDNGAAISKNAINQSRLVQKKPANKFSANIIKHKVLILFAIPGLVILLINNYLPMFGVIMAFKRIDYGLGILKSPFVGFDNFKFLFVTGDAFRITRNTVLFNLVFIIVGLILNVIVAIALNELKNKFFSKLYQTVIIMPFFLSMVVIGYLVYGFLSQDMGYLNYTLLPALGINPVDWYMEPIYWVLIIPVVCFWTYTGVNCVVYMASIVGIDEQYYEAALIDGASRWQQIVYVTIPHLIPIMIVMTLIQLGGIIKGNYGLFYQVTMNSSALYPVTDIIDTYVIRGLQSSADLGMTSAVALYQSVVGCIMILTANIFVRKIDPQSALF